MNPTDLLVSFSRALYSQWFFYKPTRCLFDAGEGVATTLGKKVFVATWGRESLAPRLRQAAFDHIDLRAGLEDFRFPAVTAAADGGVTGSDRVGSLVPLNHELGPGVANQTPSAATGTPAALPIAPRSAEIGVSDDEAGEAAFLAALENAERNFAVGGGYVGLHLFLSTWRFSGLDPSPAVRQRLLDRTKAKQLVEVYESEDSALAIRRVLPGHESADR